MDTASLGDYEQVEFFPFDPGTKRTESTLRRKDGSMFKAREGSVFCQGHVFFPSTTGRRDTARGFDESVLSD